MTQREVFLMYGPPLLEQIGALLDAAARADIVDVGRDDLLAAFHTIFKKEECEGPLDEATTQAESNRLVAMVIVVAACCSLSPSLAGVANTASQTALVSLYDLLRVEGITRQ